MVSTKINVICRDLAQHKQPHHHDKKKLIDALEECVTQLKTDVPSKDIESAKQKLA